MLRGVFTFSLLLSYCFLFSQVTVTETVVTDGNGNQGPDACATIFGPGTSGRFDFSKLDNGFNPTPCQAGWTCFPLKITIDPSFVAPTGCVTDYCGNIFVDSQGKQRKIFDANCNELWAPANGNAGTDFTFCIVPGATVNFSVCKSAADPNPNVAVSFHNCCTPSTANCPPDASMSCIDTGTTNPDFSGDDDAGVFYGLGGSLDMTAHDPCATCNGSTSCLDISYADSGALDFCAASSVIRTYTINLTGEINFVRLGITTDANGNPVPDVGPAPPVVCTTALTTEVDNVPPTITCPPDATIALDENCAYDLNMLMPAMVMDNCGMLTPIFTDDVTGLTGCSGSGIILRTWTATDDCGQTASCVQSISIEDQTAPVIKCEGPVTLYFDATCSYDLSTLVPPTITDNCPGTTLAITDDLSGLGQMCGSSGTIIRTWTATDACLVTASCSQSITIMDNTNPTLTCPVDATLSMDAMCTYDLSTIVAPVFADNCPGSSLAFTDDTAGLTGCAGTGSIVRTWTATDACSNFTTCMQMIAVEDLSAPTLTCPDDVTLALDSNCAYDLSMLSGATLTDNCPGSLLTAMDDLGGLTECNGSGTIIRTWTGEDACGQMVNCEQMITIEDQTMPVIVCPADVTLAVDDSCMFDLTGLPLPTVTDNCPDSSFSFSDDMTGLTGCSGTGTIIRTYTATDLCLLTTTCNQNIIIEDQTPPTITCPPDATLALDATCSYDLTTIADPVFMDNCSGSTVAQTDDLSGLTSCSGTGIILRTWTVTDLCMNVASCLQNISIEDQTLPAFMCPAEITLALDGSCNVDLTSITDPVVSDNCPSPIITTSDDLTGLTACSGTGLIIRTWTATDACLNTVSCLQNIIVEDQTAPTFVCPVEITLGLDANCSVDLSSVTDPIVTDNCPGATMSATDDLSGLVGCNGTGTIVRTWTAMDACLNTSACTQNIVIEDLTLPSFTCPADVTLALDADCGNDLSGISDPAITDNCPGSLLSIVDDVTNLTGCNNTGTIIRTWTATDACGNISTCDQNIVLEDTTSPTITCPAEATISMDAACAYNADPALTDEAFGTDNCGVPLFTFTDDVTGLTACSGTGTLIRTWTATDVCGLTNTCTQNIIIGDIDPPSIVCPANLNLTAGDPNNDALIAAWLPTVTASDNCTVLSVINNYNIANFMNICGTSESQAVTFTAEDECGNVITCISTIIIGDMTPPTITCPSDLILECGDPNNTTLISTWLTTVTASDPGGGGTVVMHDFVDPGVYTDDCGLTGMEEVIFTATDDCMLTSECNANITIEDTTSPAITCPMGTTVPVDGSCAYDAQPVTVGIATASDACAVNALVPTYSDDISGLNGCSGTGPISRTWSVADECGNVASCTSIIILVQDLIIPIINCPPGLTISLDGSCAYDSDPLITGTATGSDNCGTLTITYADDLSGLGSCNGTGLAERTWTATDDCLNTATCVQNIVIEDQTPPVFICPNAITLNMDAACMYDLSTITSPATSDNCPGQLLTFSDDLTGLTECGGTGLIIRTWTLTDVCGNAYSCTQDVTIVDLELPVITCPATISVSIDGNCTYDLTTTGVATATDNCMAPVITQMDDLSALVGCNGTGEVTRTFLATDNCGNTASCEQMISIVDDTPPSFTCPTTLSVGLNNQCLIDLTGVVPPAVMDNCPGYSLSFTDDQTGLSDCSGTGTIVRSWTATDACNNTFSCMQDIIVVDQIAPTFTCPSDLTLGLDVACGYDLTVINSPAVMDNCPGATVSFADDLTGLTECGGTGLIVRTWTGTDVCNNTFACTQDILIQDQTAPSFICPTMVTLNMDSDCTYDLSIIAVPTLSDNCPGGSVTFTDDLSGLTACSGTGMIVRTWLGSDACGNTFSCLQPIYIEDNIDPIITCSGTVTLAMDAVCSYDSSVGVTGAATATDNCDSDPVISFMDDLSGLSSCAGTGVIIRTFTSMDACGNVSSCTQNINVNDDTVPQITCPDDVTLAMDDACGYGLGKNLGAVFTLDNCPGFTVTHSDDLSGLTGCSFSGLIIRTHTITDACGNTASCSQMITGEDQTPPTFICPSTITINLDASCMYDLSGIPIPVVSDNCVGAMMMATDDISGLSACNNSGTIIRTWTATDACGLTSDCTQDIIIEDIFPTQIACPVDVIVSCQSDILEDPAIVSGTCIMGDLIVVSNPILQSGIEDCSGAIYNQIYTVTDGCGVTASCTRVITLDSPDLTMTCPADQLITGPGDILADIISVQILSSCPVMVNVSAGPVVGDPNNSECGEADGDIYTIVYTATDDCGTVVSCTQTFTVSGGPGCISCADILIDPVAFCDYVINNPSFSVATLDCDGDGNSNLDECTNGTDPGDPCDYIYATSMDLCAYILANPTSPLALADCDNGGISNIIECQNGDDPEDPSDDCNAIMNGVVNVCEILTADPTNPLATVDCDGDGNTNLDECNAGTNPTDPCHYTYTTGAEVCAFVLANPTSPLALADCDMGGISNIIECQNGGDPTMPSDDCDVISGGVTDVCALLAADPTSPMAMMDCDGDGNNNLDECNGGTDPNDPCDNLYIDGDDVCVFVLANPGSALANADCDNGGIINLTECQSGDDPTDSSDDCNVIMNGTVNICDLLAADPTNPLATADCDGDGNSNLDECNGGTNPIDPCDYLWVSGAEVCAFVLANPSSPLALADCDNGGITNIIECQNGDDPEDPSDDCNAVMEGVVDICSILVSNPLNPLATVDCDGDGNSNQDECNLGSNPTDPCDYLYPSGAEVCVYVLANPTSPIALADCDGGGVSNLVECQNGDDPEDPNDDCSIFSNGVDDVCALLALDPTNPMANMDCDGDGNSNLAECAGGTDPNDPCDYLYVNATQVCAFILANPTSPLALADCDGGGINNLVECENGNNPEDSIDECDLVMNGAVDVCNMLSLDPTNAIGNVDCDGDGIDNITECLSGSIPTDPCSNTYLTGADVCSFVTANPLSPLALADCDQGGVSNDVECALGNDPLLYDCNGNGVQDIGEIGVAGIRVELYDANNDLVSITMTDNSGNYIFDGLLPGDYYVKFIINGWMSATPNQGNNSTLDSDVDGSYGDGTTPLINLGPAECNFESFDLGVYNCIRIGETIWLDVNMNDMRDAHENGINGVKVELYRNDINLVLVLMMDILSSVYHQVNII